MTKAKLPRFLLDRPQKAPMGRCPLCQAHLLSQHSCFRRLYQDSHDAAKSCAGSPRPRAAKLKQQPAAASFACLSRGYAALGQGLREFKATSKLPEKDEPTRQKEFLLFVCSFEFPLRSFAKATRRTRMSALTARFDMQAEGRGQSFAFCFCIAFARRGRWRVAGWLSSMCVLSSRPLKNPGDRCATRCGDRSCLVFSRVGTQSCVQFCLIHDASQENELRKACLSLIKPSPSESLRVLSAKQCLAVH